MLVFTVLYCTVLLYKILRWTILYYCIKFYPELYEILRGTLKCAFVSSRIQNVFALAFVRFYVRSQTIAFATGRIAFATNRSFHNRSIFVSRRINEIMLEAWNRSTWLTRLRQRTDAFYAAVWMNKGIITAVTATKFGQTFRSSAAINSKFIFSMHKNFQLNKMMMGYFDSKIS